jgi:L-ribulose-5-phosphate 3-epimerase
MTSFKDRLAVCSWSLQADSPQTLVQHLKNLGISRVQLALDPLREQRQTWGDAAKVLKDAGITIVSGMVGFVGEDYTTIQTIHATGGVAPDETWEENWEIVPRSAELAASLGLPLVTFHAGFLPESDKDPMYTKMHHRLDLIADIFAAQNIDVGFETGQETAMVLLNFLKKLGRRNVGVNFDPANMILYDRSDVLGSLRMLGPWLKQVHIKDATRTKKPGAWGEEVPAGTGEVPWPEFFRTLNELGFSGNCCIEREAGNDRVGDIRKARELVEKLA